MTIQERMIDLGDINDTIDLMMRVERNEKLVAQYTKAMKAGSIFPPIRCTSVDKELFLTDGYHRVTAAKRLKLKEIKALVYSGTYEDAQDAAVESVRANSFGGQKHTNADKRKAVLMLLSMKRHEEQSDQVVADMAGVDRKYVWKLRKEQSTRDRPKLNDDKPASQPKKRVGKDGKMRPVTNKRQQRTNEVMKQAAAAVKQSERTRPAARIPPLTPEQHERAKGHQFRHVYTRPIDEEIAANNATAAKKFSGAVRTFGEAAKVFLKALEGAGYERYGEKTKEPFTPAEYDDVLAAMENGGQLWRSKLTDNLDPLLDALRIIEPFKGAHLRLVKGGTNG